MINFFGTILGFATLLITMANSATSQFFSELRRVAVNIQSDTADLQQEIQQPPAEGSRFFHTLQLAGWATHCYGDYSKSLFRFKIRA